MWQTFPKLENIAHSDLILFVSLDLVQMYLYVKYENIINPTKE